jgi:hypothetical protein
MAQSWLLIQQTLQKSNNFLAIYLQVNMNFIRRKRIKNPQSVIVFVGLIVLAGCSKNNVADVPVACDATISYTAQIKPIITVNCNYPGCHDGINTTSLADYTTIKDGASQIKAAIISGAMPRNAVLKLADKNAITCWINSGVKNN